MKSSFVAGGKPSDITQISNREGDVNSHTQRKRDECLQTPKSNIRLLQTFLALTSPTDSFFSPILKKLTARNKVEKHLRIRTIKKVRTNLLQELNKVKQT